MNERITFENLPYATSSQLNGSYLLVAQDSKSYKIKLNDLTAQLLSEYQNDRLGSMAYENKSDYALSSHDHDIYTNAIFSQEGGTLPQDYVWRDVLLRINGSAAIQAFSNEMETPEEYYKKIAEKQPKLGEMQFRVSAENRNNLTDDLDFDGWVLANGSNYTTNEFELSSNIPKVFSHDGTNFTVPNLQNNFLKFTNDLASNTNISSIGRTTVAAHLHDIKASTSKITIENKSGDEEPPLITFNARSSTGAASYGNQIHNGTGQTAIATITCSENKISGSALKNLNLKTTSTQSISQIAEPTYNILPAYVYVGKTYKQIAT